MFGVLGASVFLPFLPMTIQVLTNNIDGEYLAVPRRWDIGNITKLMLFIGPISSIFDVELYRCLLPHSDRRD